MKKGGKETKSKKGRNDFTGLMAESERAFVLGFPIRIRAKRRHSRIGVERSYELCERTTRRKQ